MSFLNKVETWISKSIPSDDGWSQIKPFIFLKLTTDGGYYGWGEAFTLPAREKGIVEIIHNLVNSLSNIESFCLLYTSPSPRDVEECGNAW